MRCWNCMEEIADGQKVCPLCGFDLNTEQSEVYHLPTGTVLGGRYEIGVVLGFGGFGVVYKAWDSVLEKIVAIKEYFPTMYIYRDPGSPNVKIIEEKKTAIFEESKQDFLNEARNIAKFNDRPNIVHVFDYFEENGTAYFVMEFLDGLPLNKYIQMGRERGEVITVECAIHIARAVLNALEDAHKEGIIHRDIKPHNIYIKKDGKVKLFDFGAAHFADNEKERTRAIVITPGYAPAEQYESKSIQGPFTDIYALGAVLYEMVTGVKPEESVNRKIIDEVVPPSELNSKVPVWLDKAIMRAMAVKPEIRFKTAAEFKKALISGKVRSAEKEIRRLKRRRNLVTAAVFLAVIGLAGYALWNIYLTAYFKPDLKAMLTLEVWAPYIGDDPELTREIYNGMSEEYNSQYSVLNIMGKTFSGITLNYTFFPENEYETKLRQALESKEGPDLFESTCLKGELAEYSEGVSMVYDDMQYEGTDFNMSDMYYFVGDETYKNYLSQKGIMPLTWDTALLYSNANEDEENPGEAVRGSVLDYEKMQESMQYMDVEVDKSAKGDFKNCWSINKKSLWVEKYAAARLVRYFLHDEAQEKLIQLNTGSENASMGGNSSAMPINKAVWIQYTSFYPQLYKLENDLTAITME